MAKKKVRTCGCVFRAVFRSCLERYHSIAASDRSGGVRFTGISASRPNEEYVADFILVARRALRGERPELMRVFDLHMLGSHDWKICTRKIGISRGNFFHDVYSVQEVVGEAFKTTVPYRHAGQVPAGRHHGEH
jgi:hypothetical protein